MSTNEAYKSYEYKKITLHGDTDMQYLDGITTFGWNIDEQKTTTSEQGVVHYVLRRNRNVVNKTELTRLEKNYEYCFKEILRLRKSQSSFASMKASVVAIIGTCFMAGSTFAITHKPPIVWLCVVLAIPAFIGWILPYFVYKKTKVTQLHKVEPFIKENYDEIERICYKAIQLRK